MCHPPRILLVTLLLAGGATTGQAQQWRWPEDPDNLEVLSEDITPEELSAVMRGFTRALGVRCHYCHDDTNGRRLHEMDFASDVKPEKEKARAMLQMVRAINGKHLARLDVPDPERVEVTCMTCHRGLPRPVMLEDILVDMIPAHGVDSAIAKYQALHEAYYGSFSYDFSKPVLLRVVEYLAETERLDEALDILALNLEQYPDPGTHTFISARYISRKTTLPPPESTSRPCWTSAPIIRWPGSGSTHWTVSDESIALLRKRIAAAGNDHYTVRVEPGVGHSFVNAETVLWITRTISTRIYVDRLDRRT